MYPIHFIMLALVFAMAITSTYGQQSGNLEQPEYYAVYERAFHETHSRGLTPTGKINVTGVTVTNDALAINFDKNIKGSAIINLYDAEGNLLLNMYAELHGKHTIIPVSGTIPSGIHFLHIFTEKEETIYELKNYQN
jgi:hypothetical protein